MRLVKAENGYAYTAASARTGKRSCRHVARGACAGCFQRVTLALLQLHDLGEPRATKALAAVGVET